MIKELLHKRLTITTTILFLLGLYSSLDRDYNELWGLFYGYLPTIGIVFTLSIANLSDNWKAFSITTSIFYCILHYLFMSPFIEFEIYSIEIKDILLPAIGAPVTLAILKFFTKRLYLDWSEFAVAFFLGAVTFIPRAIDHDILAMTISIYLWQLIVGHYYNYLKTKTTLAHQSYSA
ncbi:hypothetical protein ACFSRY_16305 [Pontibacter locisalis]|uniref:Uncharacterized protein n=1 Tax=Pontibacter locisalis TaxID=1719035 RepID=A0ABW5IQR2_9BACT